MRSTLENRLTVVVLTLIALAAMPVTSWGQSFGVVQNFGNTNGSRPLTPPILARDGNVYGATLQGGANSGGLIYKLTPQNKLTALYAFCSQANCADGVSPEFGPIQGKDGYLYGTTSNGGAHGLGVVYRLTLGGELSVLHSFCVCGEGAYPNSLVEDGQGGFYGTTLSAGAYNFGTIFHLSAGGTLTTLYSFCDSQPNCVNAYSNTGEPQPLILGSDGNVYGITTTGGQYYFLCYPGGCGTVWKMTPGGEFSIVYNFCSLSECSDDAQPMWLLQGLDGNFYGTTSFNGSNTSGGGTVFQLMRSGALNTLHTFTSAKGSSSGYAPYDLIEGSGGILYGITFFGGNKDAQCQNLIGCGTVFSVTASGSFETLHNFDAADGYAPAGLVQTSNTALKGTTSFGGMHKQGVIFV